jgi:hypothetical protein
MTNRDFLQKIMLEVSTDGKRVNWIKIKVLNVDKGAENTIKYKYNYDHENQCEKKRETPFTRKF